MKKKIALITGASSGIGAAFARLMADNGYDLWITGRREEKLNALADDIRIRNKCKIDIIVGDLLKEKDIKILENKIQKENDLEVLINNAGYGDDIIFETAPVKKQLDMLKVHVEAPVRLSHAVINTMLHNKKGYIINVSSIAGLIATGGPVNYNSTKAYLIRFTESLHINLYNTPLKVSALCPGFTHTDYHEKLGMDEAAKLRWSHNWMTAEKVAHLAWKALQRNKVVYVPGLLNKIMVFFVNALPPGIRYYIAYSLYLKN